MSVESSDRPKAGSRDPKSDFFDLLELANELQDKCDRSAQRVFAYRAVEFTAAVALAALGIGISTSVAADVVIALAYAFAGLFAGALYGWILEYQFVRRVTSRLRRDERALSEVVELLRETERSVAEQNHLTPLERARLKLHMSRFGI